MNVQSFLFYSLVFMVTLNACGPAPSTSSLTADNYGIYRETTFAAGQCASNDDSYSSQFGPTKKKRVYDCAALSSADAYDLYLVDPNMELKIVATFKFRAVPMDHRYFGYHATQRPALPRIIPWHMTIYREYSTHGIFAATAPYSQFPAWEQFNDVASHSKTQVLEARVKPSQLLQTGALVEAWTQGQEAEIEWLNVRVLQPM